MTRTGNKSVSGNEGTGKSQRQSIGLWLRGLRVQSPSLTLFSENTEEIDEKADRFLSLIDRSGGPESCWPWIGVTTESGYGRFSFAGRGYQAHRLVCTLAHGDPPSVDSEACHSKSCTTRACCNPSHLRWDSHAGNMADVAALGRQKGENNPRATITAEIAAAAWERRAEGAVALSVAFGVPYAAIRAVIRGLSWTHVTGARSTEIKTTRGRPPGRRTTKSTIATAILRSAGVTP